MGWTAFQVSGAGGPAGFPGGCPSANGAAGPPDETLSVRTYGWALGPMFPRSPLDETTRPLRTNRFLVPWRPRPGPRPAWGRRWRRSATWCGWLAPVRWHGAPGASGRTSFSLGAVPRSIPADGPRWRILHAPHRPRAEVWTAFYQPSRGGLPPDADRPAGPPGSSCASRSARRAARSCAYGPTSLPPSLWAPSMTPAAKKRLRPRPAPTRRGSPVPVAEDLVPRGLFARFRPVYGSEGTWAVANPRPPPATYVYAPPRARCFTRGHAGAWAVDGERRSFRPPAGTTPPSPGAVAP